MEKLRAPEPFKPFAFFYALIFELLSSWILFPNRCDAVTLFYWRLVGRLILEVMAFVSRMFTEVATGLTYEVAFLILRAKRESLPVTCDDIMNG